MSLTADSVAFGKLIRLWRGWKAEGDNACERCGQRQETVAGMCAACFPEYLLRRLLTEIKGISQVAGEGEHMLINAEVFYKLEEILTAATRNEDM
jgi:hypothetical protein